MPRALPRDLFRGHYPSISLRGSGLEPQEELRLSSGQLVFITNSNTKADVCELIVATFHRTANPADFDDVRLKVYEDFVYTAKSQFHFYQRAF